jgi:hypothetical protein
MKLHDSRFDNIEFEHANFEDLVKEKTLDVIDADLPETSYVTFEELQEEFGISRYQIVNTLKQLGFEPIGIKKNMINGKRLRGVGKVVFDSIVIEKIYEATPVEDIKEKARKMLEE